MDARGILTAVLEYCGAFVTQTTSAGEGLRFLRQARPDVVIADMHLPDHDATWLVRESRDVQAATPFIAISAQDFDRDELEAAGFSIFLRKPLDLPRLVEAVLAVARRC